MVDALLVVVDSLFFCAAVLGAIRLSDGRLRLDFRVEVDVASVGLSCRTSSSV